MAKLKCVAHEKRVHVLKDAVVVHRSDGSRCVVNPILTINNRERTPEEVLSWGGYSYLKDTIKSVTN